MAHLSVKQRAPLRKSFIPSRRQSRHFASRYRAMARLLHPPPLRRAAPVVRNRRHVADRGDLEAHGLERADGGLAASPGPTHRSEERRVGKEGRARGAAEDEKTRDG